MVRYLSRSDVCVDEQVLHLLVYRGLLSQVSKSKVISSISLQPALTIS